MNFFDLPKDIIKNIYEFDSTYKDIYNLNIKQINIFPKFQCYEEIFGSLFFTLTPFKGVYIYTNINSPNYKKAFKKALKKKVI